ncbi:MAG: hypothetical protein COB17_04730 [Sulfurimonas sp.]|nr:MAG: hypothetical protein COB17_04730 [Sulfurimonas sp.]
MENTEMTTISIYNRVLLALLVLTFLTISQPFLLALSPKFTIVTQLIISVFKSLLIVMFYMHLSSEKVYLKFFVLMALIVLAVFFVILGIDSYYRYGV